MMGRKTRSKYDRHRETLNKRAAFYRRGYVKQENEAMRRHEPVSATPAQQGWPLVCKRQIGPVDGVIYPVGSQIPAEKIARLRNFRALLDSHYIAFEPPSAREHAKPYAASKAEAPPPNLSEAEIDRLITRSPDAVLDWQNLIAAVMQKLRCSEQHAKNQMDRSVAARSLRRDAVRAATAIEARRRGLPSIPAVRL